MSRFASATDASDPAIGAGTASTGSESAVRMESTNEIRKNIV